MGYVGNNHYVSQAPDYSYSNDIGQKVIGSGGIWRYNKKTGMLEQANSRVTSPDGLTGEFYWGNNKKNNSGLSGILGSSTGSSTPSTPVKSDATPVKSDAQKAYEDAIKTISGGLDSANAASERTIGHIESADADLNSARTAASSITNAIGNVNSTASSLTGYADILRNMGLDTSGLGTAILNGDSSVGGLAGEYLNAIGLAGDAALDITPDRYVSQAASDTQKAHENALGQAERNLSRQGVSASSGAYGALQSQMATSLATALAAAKTKARQTGLSDRLTALTNRAGLYGNALTKGAELQQQGAQNIASAADIVTKQGDLFATAGNLANAQSNAFANIGGVEVSLGNLEVSNNKLIQGAIQAIASMQGEMAKYYADLEIAKLPQTATESGYRDGKYYHSTSTTERG